MEKGKILVVEDEAIIARELQFRLKDMGHDVPYIVATGEDAVEKAKEISPDLVLMDIQLSGQIDGIEAAKLIRSKADIPIIYLTAYPDEAIVERSKITAPFGYIIKPVGNRELNRTIELTLHKHRLERQLNESKDRFRNLVETTSDWIWEVDENVIYTYVSPKIRDILGYKPEEVLGKTPFDLMPPEEAIRASGIFKPIAASQESFENLENINLRKDGRIVTLETSGSPFFDMDGIFRGYRGIDRDITERKKAEEELIRHRENLAELVQVELNNSRELLRLSIDGMLEGYALHEAIFDNKGVMIDYRFLEFNPAAQMISGIKREEIVGKTALELYPHIVERGLMKRYANVMATGVPDYIEDFYYEGDNLDKAFDISCFRIDDRHFVCVFRDITERMKTEKELCDSEKKYHGIIETSPDLIFILERKTGKIIDINGSVCKLMGYSKDEIVGTVSGERVVSAQKNSYRRKLENLINNDSFSGEYDVRKKDGSILTIEARGAAFGDYAFAIGRDITERKQMEKALLEIEEREQQRIGYELHDGLGQMLAGISLKCQNLESNLKEKSIPEAEDISRITFLLEKTKEQLRLLMKGMLPVEMNIEGLSAALEELAWNTKEIFNVPCVFRCDMPVQLCNRIKNINLFRIAQEAVANAVKHGRPERIEISLSRENDEFKLTITDDGAGIPEISKETNCLGLKIMNYRAEMIGATLDIQSEIDRGTSITCTFYDTMDEK